MNIGIQFVPGALQRYATVGDWYYEPNGDLTIKVSNDDADFPTHDVQILVALHELVEVLLCRKRGITQAQVDEWDFGKAEYAAEYGLELGDMEGAPYRKEHRFAMLIEHLMAHEMGVAGYGRVE